MLDKVLSLFAGAVVFLIGFWFGQNVYWLHPGLGHWEVMCADPFTYTVSVLMMFLGAVLFVRNSGAKK